MARAADLPSISFAGFVTDDQREQLLTSSTVLVSISEGEGFGLAAIEALAAGVPVVALKGTVTDELFPDGSGHLLLESQAPEPLAAALIRLLADPHLAESVGNAGRQRMRDVFTIECFDQRLREALRQVS